ncbi:hypothetical protein PI125_g11421 [Phytophthora idaei]|nr:hypothetical protein PI125_g11421 [Phytophthora idaei]
MWETPEPSIVEMISRFTNTRVSNGGTYTDIPLYCAFSKESSPVCDQLDVGTYDANGIIYERDQYWNKGAAILAQASVLLLSGKLDPQTPHKYAQYLLEALDGSKRELVTFNYATHGTLWTTPMDEDDDESETCGMRLPLSYVSSNGDLNVLLLSTNDIYDGDYDESFAALITGSSFSIAGFVTTVSKENATYKATFIVFLVLFVATLALAGLFAFRWLKFKRENEWNRATDDLPDDIEISTPPEVEETSPELTTAFSTQRSKEAR